ncbi:MAG: response regulator [Candidatus Hydrogenedens sp.]|nr:response regulator [Candidatus Hydrogenedens sp.]
MPGGSARILIVDDVPDNIKLLRALLEIDGHTVTGAENGHDALQAVSTNPPDIILLDLVLPDITGFEICERVKTDPRTGNIPIIVISGMGDRDTNLRAFECGADEFLSKPFDRTLLKARIQNTLRNKRLNDALQASNADLERRVALRTEEIRRARLATVSSLARLAGTRDNETGNHVKRVANYCVFIAEDLAAAGNHPEITDSFIVELSDSSPLHDIGKVGIPDAILLKPGKLTETEFEIMKQHTLIGGETLRRAHEEAGDEDGFLRMACEITFYHHEKWNGSGYPFGLEGDAIPLSARICALADVYDALSSLRPYKEPFPHERCRAIIEEGRGTHFDPDIVDAFLRCEDKFIKTRELYADEDPASSLQKLVEEIQPGD